MNRNLSQSSFRSNKSTKSNLDENKLELGKINKENNQIIVENRKLEKQIKQSEKE